MMPDTGGAMAANAPACSQQENNWMRPHVEHVPADKLPLSQLSVQKVMMHTLSDAPQMTCVQQSRLGGRSGMFDLPSCGNSA